MGARNIGRNFLAPIIGRDRIRNFWGNPIPCCWSDCWKHASTRHQVVVPHDAPDRQGDNLVYAFCSDLHKLFWISATVPAEQRGALGNDLTHHASTLRRFRHTS